MPRLHYHAVRSKYEDFTPIFSPKILKYWVDYELHLEINETQKSGTTKYMFKNIAPIYRSSFFIQVEFGIRVTNLSFPYMLYEGYSCMYGGIYIVNSSSSSGSEVLSHCTPISTMNKVFIPRRDFSIVLIHYSEYSSHIIILDAQFKKIVTSTFPVHLIVSGNKSAQATIPSMQGISTMVFYFHSILLKLRKVQHIYINIQHNDSNKYKI